MLKSTTSPSSVIGNTNLLISWNLGNRIKPNLDSEVGTPFRIKDFQRIDSCVLERASVYSDGAECRMDDRVENVMRLRGGVDVAGQRPIRSLDRAR
jgi:hypothetical protein